MSSADWDEIKRLAADFQRAQLASTLQKLSERNCIEIISKLVELNLITIYYTNDGKEYVTPEQLTKEMQEELYVHGGRVDITDLVNLLSVDFNVITKQASILASSDPNVRLTHGQLISKQYMDGIAEEINEKLQQEGTTNITDLVKHYDLPSEFITDVVMHRLGTIIQGQLDVQDSSVIFTDAFVSRHRAHVRGVLSAITRPTPVATILSQHGFQESLFFSVAEKVIETGRVPGILTGNQQIHRAMYIPHIYSRTQNEWVDSFWKQNGYLEFEALRRLDISDPEGYIRRRLKDEDVTYIGELCVGSSFIDQIDASLDDALVSGGWVDIYPLLPTSFSPEDGNQLLDIALKNRQDKKSTANAKVFYHTVVVSNQIITKLMNDLKQLMPARAKEAIEQGAFKQQLSSKGKQTDDDSSRNKKDDRRKKAGGGKSGGGTQGRETKTKSTKNKHKGRKAAAHDSDSDDDSQSRQTSNEGSGKFPKIEFLSFEALQEEIANEKWLNDCPEELVEELAKEFQHPLSKEFQDVVQNAFLATVAVGGDARRKTHQQLQEKVAALSTTIRLAEKSVKVFDDEKQMQLRKHLLKTQCSDLVNELVLYLADDSLLEVSRDKEMTPEVRFKIIKNLCEDTIEPLLAVHKTLTTGSDLEEFFNTVDDAISAAGIMFKKKDNKKDRQVLSNHRCQLIEQLESSMDAPLTLHLACLVLYQSVTGNMLLASGKFVPHILAYIKNQLPVEQFSVLQDYQDFVIKSLTSKGDEATLSEVKTQLESLTPSVKEIAITFKKSTSISQTTEE